MTEQEKRTKLEELRKKLLELQRKAEAASRTVSNNRHTWSGSDRYPDDYYDDRDYADNLWDKVNEMIKEIETLEKELG